VDKPLIVAAGVAAAAALFGCCNKAIRNSVADSCRAVRDGIVDGPTAVKDFIEDGWNALATRLKPKSNANTL